MMGGVPRTVEEVAPTWSLLALIEKNTPRGMAHRVLLSGIFSIPTIAWTG